MSTIADRLIADWLAARDEDDTGEWQADFPNPTTCEIVEDLIDEYHDKDDAMLEYSKAAIMRSLRAKLANESPVSASVRYLGRPKPKTSGEPRD